jgi:hypothetical protein
MFRFYARRAKDTDEDQNVLAHRVRWGQDCEESSDELAKAMMFIAVACVGALFCALFGAPQGAEFMMAAGGLFALDLLLLLFGHHLCTEHCQLVFETNGAIWEPRGRLLGWIFGPRVLGDHRMIEAIQIQEAETLKPQPNEPKRYEVWIYFDEGSSLRVASSLYKQQAHQVAVLMTKSYQDAQRAAAQDTQHGGIAWAELAVN